MSARTTSSGHVRNANGTVETRSASVRFRLEPTLLALARKAADTSGHPDEADRRGPGLAAYLRNLIIADLQRRDWLDENGRKSSHISEADAYAALGAHFRGEASLHELELHGWRRTR